MGTKKEIIYGQGMKHSKLRRLINNLWLFPAWFFPWKRARVFFHKLRGVKIGNNVEIGYMVILDNRRPELITLEDNVFITAKCILLTHDLSLYNINGKETIGEVVVQKGAFVGMNSVILPGVTVGEYSIVGSGSVITKDVRNKAVVAGNPAKELKIND